MSRRFSRKSKMFVTIVVSTLATDKYNAEDRHWNKTGLHIR